MKKIKKLLFPFLNERNLFLSEKWWFRLITILYLIALILTPFFLFFYFMDSYTSCYDTASLFYEWPELYKLEMAMCQEGVRGVFIPAIGGAILGTLFIHYLIQIIFYKVIIDYIVLNNKK